MEETTVPQVQRRRSISWDPVRLELKRVADLSPLMVWITEADGYCIYINQQWYDFTGQLPKGAEGDGWLDSVHGDDRACALQAFRHATENTIAYQVEYRLCRHDGGFEWVLAVGHPYFLPDGTLGGYIGSDASAGGLKRRAEQGSVLTAREREVIGWIAKGKTSTEIAIILSIAPRTVEHYVTASMIKLGATNRVQAAVEALRRGELED